MAIAFFYGAYVQYIAGSEPLYRYLPILFVFAIIVPVLSFIIWKVRTKEFTDFDVSNRKKRQTLYEFIVPLLGLLALVLIGFKFPLKVILPVLAIFILLFISTFINKTLKVSLHTSISFLFAYLFFPINSKIAICLFCFGFLIGWSRLVLNRHQPKEVLAGVILGNIIGLLFLGFVYIW